MEGIDYRAAFDRTLYEEMEAAFKAHGIDAIHEEDFDSIVMECFRKVYYQGIAEFRRQLGATPTIQAPTPWGGHVGAIGNQGRPQGAGRVIRRHK